MDIWIVMCHEDVLSPSMLLQIIDTHNFYSGFHYNLHHYLQHISIEVGCQLVLRTIYKNVRFRVMYLSMMHNFIHGLGKGGIYSNEGTNCIYVSYSFAYSSK